MKTLIQQVPLQLNGATEVKGELHSGFSTKFVECWLQKWLPAREHYLSGLGAKAEHSHWNWLNKAILAVSSQKEDMFFWILYNDTTQGIMLVDHGVSLHGPDAGKGNIHVNFLEAAPWNYYKDAQRGYYQGVGTTLLYAAIWHSNAIGYEGRIGLHSLPQSESFYTRQGMIPISTQSAAALNYYELPTDIAQQLLAEGTI